MVCVLILKMSCQPDALKQNLALRNYNRQLRAELAELRMRTNGCGVCDTCETNYLLPGISLSDDDLTFTWSSMAGQTFLIEESTDQEEWETIEAEWPSGGTTTTFTVTPEEDGDPVYYRIRENPVVYNECAP